MSKADFIETVAQNGNMTYTDAKKAVDIVFNAIEARLKATKGSGRLKIGTFGTFIVSKRRARIGRNPRTGEPVKVKASRSLRFKPSLHLKQAAGC